MSNIKAAIIAGGKGTRIRGLTNDLIPKALLAVGGEPIVFRQLRLLARYKVCEVAVLAGYMADILEEKMLPYARQLGVHLEFFTEHKPLGTAGGFSAAKDFLGGNDFFVLYGDVAIEMDLIRLLNFHFNKKAIATIVAHPNNHPYESDLLRTDKDSQILEILTHKNRDTKFYHNLVPAAAYCFSERIFDYIKPFIKQDFIADVFPRIIKKGHPVYAYNTPEYLRDIGTMSRYRMTEEDIKSGLLEHMNFSVKRPAIFFDRDGVLNYKCSDKGIVHHNELQLIPEAAKAVQLVNKTGWLAVLTTNQPQVAKGFTTFEELDVIHTKLETLLGSENAKLDRIYFCPHHPKRGFEGEIVQLKKSCNCRKPKAGMLTKAAQELPILPNESCMIGDSWRDMGTARTAGIYAYGVRTGVGCRDCSGIYRPDLVFSNVYEAVKFAIFGIPETEAVADKIAKQLSNKKNVFTVGICGIARTGKSSFAHALLKNLKKYGVSSLHVKLDDWILPLSRRDPDSISQERAQTELYAELLSNLIDGKEITAPGYNCATRDIARSSSYQLNTEQVILLDGLFACHKTIRDNLNHTIYLDTGDDLLISRFYDFYRWKGMSEGDIGKLLAQRRAEEWKTVSEQRGSVNQIVQITRGVA